MRLDGAHFGALLGLGNLLARRGYRRAARLSYLEAAKAAPHNPVPHVNAGNTFLDEGDLTAARFHFERALQLEPALPEAHQGVSYVFARLGDEAAAQRHRDAGFRDRAVTAFGYRGEGAATRVALLASVLGGNVGTSDILDDRSFDVTRVFVEYYSERRLPECDVVFNAIGDADRCGDALRVTEALVRNGSAPAINHPAAILRTPRAAVAQRCSRIVGVRAPRTLRAPRAALEREPEKALAEGGLRFPVLLRAPGFHTGMYLERAMDARDASAVAARLPGDELLAIEYLDARGNDGAYRKYRVMWIDGRLRPLHLAIADEWKVHYFTAAMAENATRRSEEQRFLGDMESTLGPTAIAALRALGEALGLDYGGIDFAIGSRGEVLLFEANATMVIPSREVDERLAYRRPHLAAAIEATRAMVRSRAVRSA